MQDCDNQLNNQIMKEIHISVRGLVEFILRSGDIDNRRVARTADAMQEGSRIHRKIQSHMGGNYRAEVPLCYVHETGRFSIVVDGRADGILDEDGEITIDEIKGTYRDVVRIKKADELHLAQAKCYAYFYAKETGLDHIKVRITYCNIETEDIRYFHEENDIAALEKWFICLMKEYEKWANYLYEWSIIKNTSICKLSFPFEYREGQKQLISAVYTTIKNEKKLFLEAPTGVGKTISTIFPTLKSITEGKVERVFYLTAKTITAQVADDTFALLRKSGLRFKNVNLTAKDKICFIEKRDCNPESCPYAKGHFDRVNAAIYDIITHEETFSRLTIEEYARKHEVCPFEFALDISLFADGVIGDYNYLFDPHVKLKRFFSEGVRKKYAFLIDEAHNLLDRGRDMYSAVLVKEDLLTLKKSLKKTVLSEMEKGIKSKDIDGQVTLDDVFGSENNEPNQSTISAQIMKKNAYRGKSILIKKGYYKKIEHQLDKCNQAMLSLKRNCENLSVLDSTAELENCMLRLYAVLDDYLDEAEETRLEIRDELLEFFFQVSHFLDICERVDEHYVKYSSYDDDGNFFVKLLCVDPSGNLKECMDMGIASVLFSATLLPIQYYKTLLGGAPEDYEIYARSVFNPKKRGLFIANDISSRYSGRSESLYEAYADYIFRIITELNGNYMVFFPSFAFMRNVYDAYERSYGGFADIDCMLQNESMSEEEREQFLARFRTTNAEEEKTLIGFCVLGGIFGEGIDLRGDNLIGGIIIGTGLPLVCNERELLKQYFDDNDKNGFDYAYRFPGMNKVLQAAGRVIRTEDDIGIIALLDSRFNEKTSRRLFPMEWENIEDVNLGNVSKRIERFWNSWL